MKMKILLAALGSWMLAFSACQSPTESCTVKGTVQGVKDGAEIVLQDAWNKFKIISTTTVQNGTFEFHPRFKVPTHVYLYAANYEDVYANPYNFGQLKDFFLEPGTIVVDVHAEDDADMGTGATGTALNDAYHRIQAADADAKEALWEEAVRDEQTNLLTLVYADSYFSDLTRATEILGRLSPDRAKAYRKYIADMKKSWIRKAKKEERRKKDEEEAVNLVHQQYIDMEYQDTDNTPVRLSSVVDNPANRYVILDFWATWCGNCLEAFPMMREIYAKYHDKGLEIYSISQDSKAKKWKTFVAENDMPWINVLANGGKVYQDYGVKYIPMVFLIDCKTGEILVHEARPDLETILSELLP